MRIKLILTQLLLWALAVGAAVLTGAPDFYALLLLPVILTGSSPAASSRAAHRPARPPLLHITPAPP